MKGTERPAPPKFWPTVRLLLRAARKRALGRQKRQNELLYNKSQGRTGWSGVGFFFTVLFMALLNGMAGAAVYLAVDAGQRLDAERDGKIVVSAFFLSEVQQTERWPGARPPLNYQDEANKIFERYGGSKAEVEQKLRDAVRERGSAAFVTHKDAAPGLKGIAQSGRLTAMLGSMALLWWGVMIVFQGEGLEMDLQRRRHPMWEWLYSHPISTSAIFFAEIVSPLAANPTYWSAPLFVAILYGMVYGVWLGIVAALVIGIPLTVAAACLGKALEIGVILRFSPRTRGAMIGLMGWLGYASMMLLAVGALFVPKAVQVVGRSLAFLTVVPWPWLRLFLGGLSNGSFSFASGVAMCWSVAAVTLVGAVRFSVWGAQQGLAGNFAAVETRVPQSAGRGGTKFGKEPLYRKEFLWFVRDRSALVQTILIPLTVASLQVFNLRGILKYAEGSWNFLCGGAILFGTYFLWVLGPKSLASEGQALWISLTWPRGLESLLKAKAWLWSLISYGVVAIVLGYAAFLFPASEWKIALVGVGWLLFGRSMAEKTVTLVTVASQSGEPEKIPAGRRWAAQLGMLTFAIGVLTQQWTLAVVGIVYSYVTAAAMWQNFRARLPYLYDPWSEKLPPPPTVMHAMVSISVLIEVGAVLMGIVVGITGRENAAIAQAASYAVAAAGVALGAWHFLDDRGVSLGEIAVWRDPPRVWLDDANETGRFDWASARKFAMYLGAGALGGVALGFFAHGYLAAIRHIPEVAEMIRKSAEEIAKIPGWKQAYAVMAVGIAPFAEEYLFRGLLFRALDREWGGWRAVCGSAAFFAVYHPPLAWLPVFLLGATNALLFKKTRRLAPCVVLHMVYNAVVLS